MSNVAGPKQQGVESARPTRDLRIDFFRGLALLFIFIDHVPGNAAAAFTLRNFGFADAAEIFVFLSGYSAALAYGRRIELGGLYAGVVATLRRAWTIYVAHLLLLLVCIVLVLCATELFGNRAYLEEMNVGGFITHPQEAMLHSLFLRFRATNLDVLPLYVLLLAATGPIIAGLRVRPKLVVGASLALWAAAGAWNWNLETYPHGAAWFFNPFCWQFLFVIGCASALYPNGVSWLQARRSPLVPIAVLYLLFSLGIVISWHMPDADHLLPGWLARAMYPINKSNLDVLRLVHFLALAYLTSLLLARSAPWLTRGAGAALVLCGQHSLVVFCLGTALAFIAHVLLVEYGGGKAMYYLLSAAGCLILIGTAWALDRFAKSPLRSSAARPNAVRPADDRL